MSGHVGWTIKAGLHRFNELRSIFAPCHYCRCTLLVHFSQTSQQAAGKQWCSSVHAREIQIVQ